MQATSFVELASAPAEVHDAPRRRPLAALVRGLLAFAAALNVPGRIYDRWLLSKAKHRSLRGHPRLARRVAGLVRFYEYADEQYFCADGAPEAVAARRRGAFARLAAELSARRPVTLAQSRALAASVSDVAFTSAYRVPFQFRARVRAELDPGCLLVESNGVQVVDPDGNVALDVAGSYGVNLFGNDFYKRCIERGALLVGGLGPVLGAYHPIIAECVRRLLQIAQQDEVSFHMSGTEAVMQAVR